MLHKLTVFLLALGTTLPSHAQEEMTPSHPQGWSLQRLQEESQRLLRQQGITSNTGRSTSIEGSEELETKTILVECEEGESIDAKLDKHAERLIIEIRGICEENVLIQRDHVVLRGADPATDGIRGRSGDPKATLTLRDVSSITIENLSIGGGPDSGLLVIGSDEIEVRNSWFRDNGIWGVAMTRSTVVFEESLLESNTFGGFLVSGYASLFCRDCTVRGGFFSVGLSFHSTGQFVDMTIETPFIGIASLSNTEVSVFGSTHIAGSIVAGGNSSIRLFGTSVVGSPFFIKHEISDNSYLLMDRWLDHSAPGDPIITQSSVTGDIVVESFSKVTMLWDSTLTGELLCIGGGDAFCRSRSNIIGPVRFCRSCDGF